MILWLEKNGMHSHGRAFKEPASRKAFVFGNGLLMTIVAVFMLIPIMKILSDSFDVSGKYSLNLIPSAPSLEAYKSILSNQVFLLPFLISILVTVTGTGIALLLTTMSAYVLTQKQLPGRMIFMYLILITMVFNGGLIPTYMTMRNLGLLDSLWAVILPLSMNTYYLILMKNFFSEIPASMSEAAEMDGCSAFGTLWKIILPMSKPVIAAIGLFYAVVYWNEFFLFIIYIDNREFYNFQVLLREMILNDDNIQMFSNPSIKIYPRTLQNAAIIIAIVPVVILYPFLQKYFVTGITLGAVKG
jgi:putative aldouronate transport system permease protein